MPLPLDLTGKKFGRLTAIEVVDHKFTGNRVYRFWKCLCSCGQITIVRTGALRSGNTQSCGCLQREHQKAFSGAPSIHGHTRNGRRSLTYSSWEAMHKRCRDPRHPAFNRYAERGITITKRWNRFENFLEDMGKRPVETTLERKNNDFGYFKENCKWAPRDEQNQNKTVTKLTFKKACEIALRALRGETHKSIAADFGVSSSHITGIANGRYWKRAFKHAELQFQLTVRAESNQR
jgi:hypothetical protein